MYMLSKSQKLVYDMEQYAGGSIAVICGCMLMPGERPLAELTAAVNALYRLNPVLRTRISGKEQRIEEYKEQKINSLPFGSKKALDDYAKAYARIPLDFNGNLCEITVVFLPDQFGFLIKLHHIIGDAWTLALLGSQTEAFLNGEPLCAYAYADHLEDETAYLQSDRYNKDRAFFLEQFQRRQEVTYLSDKQETSFAAERKSFAIESADAAVINAYANAQGVSPFVLFFTVLSTYMSRVKENAEKFYIGTALVNRAGTREKKTAGMFVNTVPVLVELDNEKTFADNLKAVQRILFGILRHQKFNYGDVLSTISEVCGFSEKLYDVMLSYQNATIAGIGKEETTWYHCGAQTESLQIHIDDRDREGIFRLHYDYQTDKFTAREIDALHGHLLMLLFSAIAEDNKKLYALPLLLPDEEQKLLHDFNNTAADYPREKCVHTLFEEQAARTPDKTAVIACDGTLTYRELNEQANRIAHGLMEKGVKPGDIVAFALPRRSYLIAAMFGILKAGAAYLPVDPDYPQERIDYMLKDSRAAFFITENTIAELVRNSNAGNPNLTLRSESLCYCIYTSGSTGKPKGTLLNHRNVVNYVQNNNNNNVIHLIIKNDYQTILSVTTVGFDIFVTESLMPLTNGRTVLLANESQAKIQTELNALVKKYPVDVMQTTPTKMNLLISDRSEVHYLKQLKAIILGGEALDHTLVEKLQELTEAKIYNIYGPTETTVWVSNAEITNSAEITIGKPIANTQIYIVDKYLRPVPIGVTGELCIAGDGVGAGYLNRPELTAEKFIDNPFGKGKLYKTGDLAYWREDGNIVYVGRNDFQVKIRGLRIELGEIENAICGVDGISQAVVVVRKNSEGRQLICAFYTGTELDAKEIRAQIGKTLPKYMLPHCFTHLDAMPLTTSGKVNRKALPEIDLAIATSNTEYVLPKNQRQKELCKLMEKVLGTSPIGITDSFFDLGGDSLKAIEFVSKAHSEGIYFNLQNVFDYPSVEELSACIENGDRQEHSFADRDFTAVNAILEKNQTAYITAPKAEPLGNILLAGATGYLGIHILADFLDKDDGIASCLVRGKDATQSKQRLQELLTFYFGRKYEDMCRIEVVCADLQKELFGLAEQEYEALLRRVDTVINAAASVKHYGSYRYFYESNVETVKRLIAFCNAANAKLIHTSTLSVSGNTFGDDFDGYISKTEKHFDESSLYIGQPLENVYARSKFEAELEVLEAMRQGLRANIMRMGNLSNRLSDGVFQKNHETNAALRRITAILELGCAPEYLMDIYAEFTPIDEAANAVMTLTRHFSSEQTVFHINSTKVVYMDRLLEYFNALGYPLKTVSGAEFTAALRETAKRTDMEHIFETFINDMDENEQLNYDSNIRIENDFTVQYLKNLGFAWSDIDLSYFKKYADYFKKVGYWA